MNILIAGDHAGFEYKTELIEWLSKQGHTMIDLGPSSKESCDYPDYAHEVGYTLRNKAADIGILICGSGNGVSMTANRYKTVRAALCWKAELAELARKHGNANVLSLPARFITLDEAKEIVNVFLTTEFEGGRHQVRIDKIDKTR
jgi:ribose 5-phosphate isomerase B